LEGREEALPHLIMSRFALFLQGEVDSHSHNGISGLIFIPKIALGLPLT